MRAQAALEYMIIVAIVLSITIPLIGYFYIYTTSSVQISQAQESTRAIANAISYVASGGPGTSTTITVNIPEYLSSIFIGNKTVMFTLDIPTGHTEVYETVSTPIAGYINYVPGSTSQVRVTNFGDFVQVGDGILFSPTPLKLVLSRGETKTFDENLTDITPNALSLTYSLTGEHVDWFNILNFPNSISSRQTKTFKVQVSVPSDATSGEYYINLLSKNQITYDQLPILLKVVGVLHNVVIQFYSDSEYTHPTDKFFPGDTVYFKIVNIDDDGQTLSANGTYNLTHPIGTKVNNGSYSKDVYFGSYKLSSNWNEVHGMWGLSAISSRDNHVVSNSSTFKVSAELDINVKYNCDEVTGNVHWWNSNWSNRLKLKLYGQETINGLQVKLDIKHEPGMNSDYSDLRFIYWNGTNTQIPYYIQSYNSTDAIVWIKVPKLVKNEFTTIYMYYNNSNAISESNPYSVFDFYDDFNSVNASKWSVSPGTQYTLSNGVLKITQGAFGLANPLSFDLRQSYIVEANVSYNSYSESEYSGDLQLSSSKFVASGNARSDSVVLYMVRHGSNRKRVGTWIGSGSTNDYDVASGARVFLSSKNKWYILGISINSTGVYLWKDNSIKKSYTTSFTKTINYLSLGSYYGDGTDDIKDTSYSWIRVRKYAKQPIVDFGAVEKKTDTPTCYLNWWNNDWKYRRWVDITNEGTVTEYNTPVMITLNSSNINFTATNGNDIRVIFNGNQIPYWIENWNSTSKNATIWVKLPYLNASSTERIWIYYGNPNAASESNVSAVFFLDDMEHGTGKWIYTGLWHLTTRRYESPTHSFWYGQESTGNYDTGSANSGYLETKNWVYLSSDPVLYYWEYRETEQTQGYDQAYVQVSTDNQTWTTVDNTYTNDYGSVKAIDLSQFANKKVLIRFYFNTVDGLYNDYEGWYIDDVFIYTIANAKVTPEADAFKSKPKYNITLNIVPLDQYNLPRIGTVSYLINHNGTNYDSGQSTTDNLIKVIPLDSNSIGTWLVNATWTNIQLTNSTKFVVKSE